MKKLLLVLVVVAMASFLLVGCNPITPDDGDDDDGGGVVVAEIVFDKEYTNTSGVTFIACDGDITVTLPTAAPLDYVVYVAVKNELPECDEPELCDPYCGDAALTPNADRTVWTIEGWNPDYECDLDECEPICVVALLKHPCCAGEEIALRVVTPDCDPPEIPDFTFKCLSCNPCETVCEPKGATFSFTSMGTGDACNPGKDTCLDACSGVGEWSFTVGDVCDSCTLATGTGCPVEGTAACGCLPWQTLAERAASLNGNTDKTYDVLFDIADNVGNKAKQQTYQISVDTDEVTFCVVADNT
jgi:hypothetical protein